MSRSPLADFKPLDELPEFTRTALLELLTRGADIEFKNMSARLSPLGIDVLTDLSWTESHGSGKNRRTVTVERTVMFFHRPESKLPNFTITHHEGFLGRLFSSRSGTVQTPSLEFKDRESFNTKYTVESPVPVSAMTLFDDVLVDALDQHDGMDVIGDQNGIMAWRDSDDLIKGDERDQLAIDASTIFLPVVNDPGRGAAIASSNPGSYMDEQIARWKQDDSSEARALLKKLVTREQVDELLSQATPRRIPHSILKRTLGMNLSVIIAGLVMVIFCGGLGVLGVIFTNDIFFSLILILLGLVGCLIFGLAWRWRRRRLRMLRRGQIVDARITSIEALDLMDDDEVLHTVTFQTTHGHSISMDLQSDPTRIARDLMYSDTKTRVLIDSEETGLGVWLEGWVAENIPD
ncbi:MAG: hypothetical protein CMJ40_02805 [Phycisphaerae bacterium]|nr:hypothetical protein [Phycisphaerae bacterium]|tara:strand:+ start:2055 stop:3272 length:1218 start_codon:yes stop_codon:yes gene_type:complete